jgi:uncharacterized protein (TIGR03437 family)
MVPVLAIALPTALIAQEAPATVSPVTAKRLTDLPPALPAGFALPNPDSRRFEAGPLTAKELSGHPRSGPAWIGVPRALSPDFAKANGIEESLPGGQRIWRAELRSQDAVGVRVHFKDFSVGGGKVWVYAPQDPASARGKVLGPYSGTGPHGDGEFWSGTVFSDTAIVEYDGQPGDSGRSFPPFELDAIAHLWHSPIAPARESKASALIPFGTPLYCELDVTCNSNYSSSASGVVVYVYIEGEYIYGCSGAMINTLPATFKPYVLTANHCIYNNSQAQNVEVYFNYQTSVCNGIVPDPSNVPVVEGAQFLVGAPELQGDYSLLLLSSPAPGGTTLFGWTTTEPAVSDSVSVIEHPQLSWARIAFGYRANWTNGDSATDPPALYYQVNYNYNGGVTEAGSSGSPLLNAQSKILGNLTGGSDPVCNSSNNWDIYGRFSIAYPALQPWINPSRVATTAVVVSGDGQSGLEGQALSPLIAVVYDQTGAPMPNVAVNWVLFSGSASLTAPTSTTTDSNGRASTGVTLGYAPGPAVVWMSVVGNTSVSATFHLTVNPPSVTITKISGDGQSVMIGQAFQPLTVQVTDSSGNALPGIAVSFNVTSGVATPNSRTATTNAQGLASAAFTAGATPGQIAIVASAGGQSATFTLTVRPHGLDPSTVVFLNGASFQPGAPIGAVVTIQGVGLTTGLTIPPGSCLSAIPDGNLQRGLPTTLAGIQVVFSTRVAPILGICVNADGTEQVNVQAPFELAPATITVLIKMGIGTAELDYYIPNVTVFATQPGIFEYNVQNTRIAIAQRPNGTIVSPSNPAKAGETIRLYVNGIGWVMDSTDKQVQTNQPGYPGQLPWNATASVSLNYAGVPGAVAEFAQNLIGVFIVSFQVPPQSPSGTLPITVSVATNGLPTTTSVVSRIPVSQ